MTGMWWIAVGTAADWMISGTLAGVGGIFASGCIWTGVWKLAKKDASFGKVKLWAALMIVMAAVILIGEETISFEDPLDRVFVPICASLNAFLWFGMYWNLRKVICEKAEYLQIGVKKEKLETQGKTNLAVAVCHLFFTLLASWQLLNGEWFVEAEISALILGFGVAVLATQVMCMVYLIEAWASCECPEGLKLTFRGMIKTAVIVAALSLAMASGLSDSREQELRMQNAFDQVHAASLTLSREILAWDTPELWGNATWNLWQEYRDLPGDVEIAGDYQDFRKLLISLERLDWDDPHREEIAQTISDFTWSYSTIEPGLWVYEIDEIKDVAVPEKLREIVDYLEMFDY